MSDHILVTKEQLEGVALAAARVAAQEVKSSLTTVLGINLENVESVEAFKADIRFAGTLRTSSHTLGSRVALATLSGLVMAIAVSSWQAVKTALHIS